MAKKKRPNAQGKAAKAKAQAAGEPVRSATPKQPQNQPAAASAPQKAPASSSSSQPSCSNPRFQACSTTSEEAQQEPPPRRTLRATLEASLRFLEHGFVAEAFTELHSALHPKAPEPAPDHLARVSEVSGLISDAHQNVASRKPTIGLERLEQAEKLWPKKDAPNAGTPETLAAADRIRLLAHWWRKDYDKVYEVTTSLAAAGDRSSSTVPLRMVACYELAHFDDAAEAAKLYLASAAESDPLANERRVLAEQISQVVHERNTGNEAYKQQKWERAITFYVKAVRTAEKMDGGQKAIAALYYNLAMAQLKAEHIDAAADYFTEALEHDSTHMNALRNRAVAYEKLEELDLAFDDLQDAYSGLEGSKDTAARAAVRRDLDRVSAKLDRDEADYGDGDEDYDNADEDEYSHPYNCGCHHDYMADEYARFFEATMQRGFSNNKAVHYRTLGIAPGASEAEVKTAFKALARQHHPDKGGDAEKFKEVRHAYGQLTGEADEAVPECVIS
ncbi:hypothetical protein JCM3774_005291 [Rhodotorula dairenensis]